MPKLKQGGKKRLTVSQAANKLGIAPMQLSLLLQENKIPQIGFAMCSKLNSKRKHYSYIIYEVAVEEFLKNGTSLALAN